jgi:ABC-type transport system involved in cytochrome bd biosynthesis fused ATPase/permease subunit
LVEVGALGLGLALKALLVSTLEPTGILAAGVVAAVGLTIIPYRRRKAAEALRSRTEALRAELRAHLTESFERETGQAVDRMSGAVAPYGRFVRAESAQLEAQLAGLTALQQRFETLRGRIAAVAG